MARSTCCCTPLFKMRGRFVGFPLRARALLNPQSMRRRGYARGGDIKNHYCLNCLYSHSEFGIHLNTFELHESRTALPCASYVLRTCPPTTDEAFRSKPNTPTRALSIAASASLCFSFSFLYVLLFSMSPPPLRSPVSLLLLLLLSRSALSSRTQQANTTTPHIPSMCSCTSWNHSSPTSVVARHRTIFCPAVLR